MCQFSVDEIMIVGGFNGKFISDYYTIKVEGESGKLCGATKAERQNANQNLFPFQVPTVGESKSRQVMTIDWSNMVLHVFANN